ncbi:MAG: glutathione S-transferase N-terminal domain-containing protein [Thermoleophilaceae bacterium]|nr:glutathione S-transferase N-terminal domain-containing protein [Thermoleophilaceae bacterium]
MNHEVTFYGFAGSHPCEAVYAAARHKGLDFKTVNLPPAIHRLIMRVKFGGTRVPGATINGMKVQGTSSIFLALDYLKADPPLFPSDPEERGRVIAAEHWGEGEFQDIGRRLIWAHLSRSPETVRAWAAAGPPGLDQRIKYFSAPHLAQIAKFGNGATDEQVEKDLRHLPMLLDRVDELIAEGVIGGDEPNAADFQIFSSVAMWSNMRDIRPAIKDRPCGEVAARLFPEYKGVVPSGLLPESWFAELRETALSSPA